MEDIKNIIESLLFVSENPLSIANIKNVLELDDPRDIRNALKELADDYESRNGAILLHEVAGGFQIRTRPEYNQWVKRLIQPKASRLSKAALETLAIIAYKQPIIRNDIEHIRGVDCGGVIRILLERKLIRVLGRKEIPGRPLIYGTTKQFLEVFDLKNLRDLPTPKEIEELRASAGDSDDMEPGEDPSDNEDLSPEGEDLSPEDEDTSSTNAEEGISEQEDDRIDDGDPVRSPKEDNEPQSKTDGISYEETSETPDNETP